MDFMISDSFYPRGLRAMLVLAGVVAALASAQAAPAKKPDPKKPEPKARPAQPAQPGGPALLGSFGEWGAYTAKSGKEKTCYALGKPKDRLPASLKRDPGYVFISNRPGEGVRNEVSIVMGFDVKPDSAPKAEIGTASFEMVAKGANLWVKNAAQEGQFVEALRKGQRLTVKATSKKGNPTTDNYALAGLVPAMDRIGRECQEGR